MSIVFRLGASFKGATLATTGSFAFAVANDLFASTTFVCFGGVICFVLSTKIRLLPSNKTTSNLSKLPSFETVLIIFAPFLFGFANILVPPRPSPIKVNGIFSLTLRTSLVTCSFNVVISLLCSSFFSVKSFLSCSKN